MKYKTKDGEVIEGFTSDEVVNKIKNGSRFDGEKSMSEFIEDMSKRMNVYDGSVVRHQSPELFVEDLLACGWLKII